MNFKEKIAESKQRKEAKKFFNQNNDAKLDAFDWIKIIIFGFVMASAGSVLMFMISSAIHFQTSFLAIIVGYLTATIVKYFGRYSSMKLAIASTVLYFVGLIVGFTIYQGLYLLNGLSLSMVISVLPELFKVSVSTLLSSSPISLLVYIIGGVAAFYTGRD